jgi:hypothetical protein
MQEGAQLRQFEAVNATVTRDCTLRLRAKALALLQLIMARDVRSFRQHDDDMEIDREQQQNFNWSSPEPVTACSRAALRLSVNTSAPVLSNKFVQHSQQPDHETG